METVQIQDRTAKLLDEFCRRTLIKRDEAADILLMQKLTDYWLKQAVSDNEAEMLKGLILPQREKEDIC